MPDRRFVETGAALARLGVPLDTVLDEWEELRGQTDRVADRFIDLFEDHLLPTDWDQKLDDDAAVDLARTLAELRTIAKQVAISALDASLAARGRLRLAPLASPAMARQFVKQQDT